MTGPLAGTRILELGHFIAAPYCAMTLADLGAEIVKIERPGSGDPFRTFGGPAKPAGSHNFYAFNRGKKSVAIDIRAPTGQEALRRLAATADALVENFRPGYLARHGLDAAALQAAHPRLVFCSITGFSTDGPYRERPAYDTIGQSLSGMLGMCVDPEDPRLRGPTFADQIAGLQAATGILAALVERGRTGRGAHVEISLLDAAIAHSPDAFTAWTQAGVALGAETRAAHSHAFVFACADGRLVAIHVSSNERFWRGFLAATESEALERDPRFATREARVAHGDALRAALRPVFLARDRATWLARLAAADVPAAELHAIPDVLDDPEVRHGGLFQAMEDPVHGTVTAMRRALRLDGSRGSAEGALPPLLGADSAALLGSVGYGPAEIEALTSPAR